MHGDAADAVDAAQALLPPNRSQASRKARSNAAPAGNERGPGGCSAQTASETAPLLVNVSVPDAWALWATEAGVPSQRVARLRQRDGARYDLLSMALNATLAGIGVGLLPDFLIGPALAEKRLVPLSRTSWCSSRSYHLSYPPEKAELPALLRFREWIVAQARAATPA